MPALSPLRGGQPLESNWQRAGAGPLEVGEQGEEGEGGREPSKPVGRQPQKGSQGSTGKVKCLDGLHVHHLVPEAGSWGQEPAPGPFKNKTRGPRMWVPAGRAWAQRNYGARQGNKAP